MKQFVSKLIHLLVEAGKVSVKPKYEEEIN